VEHVISEVASEPEPTVVPSLPPPAPSGAKLRELEARSRRIARWQTVLKRHAAGATLRSIARDMGMSRMTVRRLLQTPDPPRNRPAERPRRGGLASPSLQPYRSYLERFGLELRDGPRDDGLGPTRVAGITLPSGRPSFG
jgi:hypothetical protein